MDHAYWSCWTPIRRRRMPWTLIGVAGLLFATTTNTLWTLIGVAGLLFADDEYHGRLLELLDSYSPTTNTMDECHGRLLELLDSYSPTTNTMDAYWS